MAGSLPCGRRLFVGLPQQLSQLAGGLFPLCSFLLLSCPFLLWLRLSGRASYAVQRRHSHD
jgi:hypothetical protein